VGITFHNEEISYQPREKNRIRRWVRGVIESHHRVPGNIAFIFTSNEQLLRMNREYLNHNYFTDVITFEYSGEKVVSGDVFISVDQVFINAEHYHTGPSEELRRVMIHGVLHLLGYDDTHEEEKKEMRKMENEALNLWQKSL
jgi:probable rRNA maturation factor